jgi:hypothetical protein
MPVNEVNADHHKTILVSTRRGPMRSPSAPVGISNALYEMKKTLVTHPHAWGLMCRLSCIRGPATAIHTRSM